MPDIHLALANGLNLRSADQDDYRLMSRIYEAACKQKRFDIAPSATWDDVNTNYKRLDMQWQMRSMLGHQLFIMSCPPFETNLPVTNKQGEQFCGFCSISPNMNDGLYISNLYSVMPARPGPKKHYGLTMLQMIVTIADLTQRPYIELCAETTQCHDWYVKQGFIPYPQTNGQKNSRQHSAELIMNERYYPKALKQMQTTTGISFQKGQMLNTQLAPVLSL